MPNGDLLIGRHNTSGVFTDAPIRIAQASAQITLAGTVVGGAADFSNGVVFGRSTDQAIRSVRNVIYGGSNNMAVTQLLDGSCQQCGRATHYIAKQSRLGFIVAGCKRRHCSFPGDGICMNMGSQAGAGNVVGNWDGISKHRVTVSSSEGVTKRSIKAVTDGLAAVMALKPITYRPASEQEEDRDWPGFIVEDVVDAGLHDLVVNNGPDLPRGLAYDRVSVYLVNAVQQLSARVEELSAEVEALKNGT